MSVLVVLDPGSRTLVQDLGFRGGRDRGVPRSGVLDRDGLTLLNGLLGNPAGTAALEIAVTAPRFRVEDGPVRIACGAGLSGHVLRAGEKVGLDEWSAVTLASGDELVLLAPARGGTALLGIKGGLNLPRLFDSHATLLTSVIGGLEGRALRTGDRLHIAAAACDSAPMRLSGRLKPFGCIRVVLGPQAEWFSDAALQEFLSADWLVTPALDRMGMRLLGPALAHSERGADIISDGVVPGAIQVPAEGQPIVLLADAQTTGGYPKIATIISADLSAVARMVPGDRLRFRAISVAEAEEAARDHARALERICESAEAMPVSPSEALYRCNLVSGGVNARQPDHFPGHLEPRTGGT
ncbi:biotin-dependent carboxyltransferase family protein [Roseovarius sp. S4756]|uniref:5-oxoprolinase subunit C family protein n=1 Tax=Roseovarius maritimus TaxID=3342637 RepID=UPI0037290BBE